MSQFVIISHRGVIKKLSGRRSKARGERGGVVMCRWDEGLGVNLEVVGGLGMGCFGGCVKMMGGVMVGRLGRWSGL